MLNLGDSGGKPRGLGFPLPAPYGQRGSTTGNLNSVSSRLAARIIWVGEPRLPIFQPWHTYLMACHTADCSNHLRLLMLRSRVPRQINLARHFTWPGSRE